MKQDDFYIGYSEEQPSSLKKFMRKSVIVLLLIVIIVGAAFSLGQKPFKNSTFELGQLSKVEGTFYKKPFPMLRIAEGNGYKNILLLGFGKFGANDGVKEIEKQSQKFLDGSRMTLTGTLIYYNGKTLMQLEPNLEGNYEVKGMDASIRQIITKGQAKYEGEIVDPKCFFGVMKPGFGKIHRSCAVRCISGGIPPVLVVQQDVYEDELYFLLTDEMGNPINKAILEYVGKPIAISGQVDQVEDWNVLKVNMQEGIQLINKESRIYPQ